MRWFGENRQVTWEPKCNVPKAILDAFDRGDQQPRVDLQKVEKQFGVTTVTNIKVMTSDERSMKRIRPCDVMEILF